MSQFIQQIVWLHSSSFLLSTHYGHGTFLGAEATMQSRAGSWSPGAHCSHLVNDGRANCLLSSHVPRLLEPLEGPPSNSLGDLRTPQTWPAPHWVPTPAPPACRSPHLWKWHCHPPGTQARDLGVACRDLLLPPVHPAPTQSICNSHEALISKTDWNPSGLLLSPFPS